MKKLRKLITLLLVAVMCLSLLPATVLAEEEVTEELIEEVPEEKEEVSEEKEEIPEEKEEIPEEKEEVPEDAEEIPENAEESLTTPPPEFDIESAKVTDIVMAMSEVDAPGTVAVSVKVDDNITSIASGKIVVRHSASNTSIEAPLTVSGDELTGYFDIPVTAANGEYVVATVWLKDKNDNTAYFFGKGDVNYEKSAAGNKLASALVSKSFVVHNAYTEDTDPPVIVSITVDETVEAGSQLSVTVKAVDQGSGIKANAKISFRCAYTGKEFSGSLSVSGDTLTGDIDVPGDFRGGDFVLKNIYVEDNANNGIWYFGKGDSNYGKAAKKLKLSNELASTSTTVLQKQDIPVITYAQSVDGGIKLSWGKVSNVQKYNIQYMVKGVDTEWNNEATVSSLSYTFKKLYSSGTYVFRVRCVSPIPSAFSDDKEVVYLEAPVLKKIEGAATGVKLTWDAVNGATSYTVMYKQSGKTWLPLDTTSSTSYTTAAGKLIPGTKYVFKVKCSAPVESKASAEKAFTYLAAPVIKVKPVSAGIKVTWDAVKAAKGYTVEYSTDNVSWKVAGTTGGKSFTVKNLTSGTKYYFRVKCYKPNVSEYSSVEELLWIAAPKLLKLKKNGTTRTLTWAKVDGATGYKILRKRAGKSWQEVTTVSASETSYIDTVNPMYSGYYYYTVVAFVGADYGPYNGTGLRCHINANGK